MKRFKVESQGFLRIIWNVLDTKTNTFSAFALSGKDAKVKAIKFAKKLNNDKRFKQ